MTEYIKDLTNDNLNTIKILIILTKKLKMLN